MVAVRTVTFGVTGYSLAWDQVAYWGSTIVTSVPEAFDNLIPGIGSICVYTLRGSYTVGQSTLTRSNIVNTQQLQARMNRHSHHMKYASSATPKQLWKIEY